MKSLDLFTGIGGMALHLPFEPVMYCEIDPYVRTILERRIKSGDLHDAPIWDDISTLDPPDHDILLGGFPCQDISSMGLKKGFSGTRSSLYFEILRIVKLKHPKQVFLENVRNILNMPGCWHAVLKTLHAEGYDMRWCIMNVHNVGGTHRRARWFLLGNLRETPCDAEMCDLPAKMSKFGSCIRGKYTELRDPKLPVHRMSEPLVFNKIPGVKCRGEIIETMTRYAWSTPRVAGCRACRNLTQRGASDLPSQARFEQHTKHRHMNINLRWLETLMGLPGGWTDNECEHVEAFPGFGKEIYDRMKPDKDADGNRVQKNYYKRWKTMGNMCVPQVSQLAYSYLIKI